MTARPSSPYKGLNAFDDSELDALLFFGREREREIVVANLLPVTVMAKLRRSHLLFLGYAPDTWSLRVFLRRVWGGQRLNYRSWAVEPEPKPLAREFWRHVDVELLDVPLDRYVAALEDRAGLKAAAR